MRKLEDQIGVQAPSSDYVKGRIVDNQTLINEGINGDIIESIHKMVSMAGIVENGLPDNTTNGHQILQALRYLIEVYSNLSNQGGIVWRRVNIGAWDMNTYGSREIPYEQIPGYQPISAIVSILSDSQDYYVPINCSISFNSLPDGYHSVLLSPDFSIYLNRRQTGFFDSPDFSNAIMNRGHLLISYIPI